eukprot:gene370-675_t
MLFAEYIFLDSKTFLTRVNLNRNIENFRQESSLLRSKLTEVEPNVLVETSSYESDMKKTAGWVSAALIFAAGIASTMGTTSAVEFMSGYVLEESLSIDNLFVFLVLFDYFAVEKKLQSRVLNYGIYGAIVLRGLFIGAGALALEQFHQVLLLFSVVLFASSYGILFSGDEEEENLEDNAIIKLAKKYFKSTDKYDGDRFFTAEGLATPLFLCLVCIELSDVVFAFDSVPAVFGVTSNPFIVYTSNIFAIAGLRSLFGVLSKAAVGVVLAFIAAKLAAETFNIELVNPLQSLTIVLTILGVGVGASLSANKKENSISA